MIKKKNIFVLFFSFVLSINVALSENNNDKEMVRFVESKFYGYQKQIEGKNFDKKTKEQLLLDNYYNIFDFEWMAKMSIGLPYKSLSQQQQKEYVIEFSKLFCYSWLPSFDYDKSSGISVNILPQVQKINDKDAIVKIELKAPDGKRYELEIRVRDTGDPRGKYKILNLIIDGIDVAVSYRAQFNSYIEEHMNNADSILVYLKKKNADFSTRSKVVFPKN